MVEQSGEESMFVEIGLFSECIIHELLESDAL